MKEKTFAITLTVALAAGLASLDALAGKGGGGGGAAGIPATGMGGMSKGVGSGGGMKGGSGMGGKQGSGGMSGMGEGLQPKERYRHGEKDTGVRTREGDYFR